MNQVVRRSVEQAAASDSDTVPAIDVTHVQASLISEYAGALRRLRDGAFDISLPRAADPVLNQLGQEIGSLADALEQRFEQIARLARISADVNAGLVLDEILERVYESFRGVIPFDRLGCALIDDRTHRVRARWARSESSQVLIPPGYSQPLAGSSLEWIVTTGQPRLLNDLEEYLERNPASDATRRIVAEGMRSSLTCPLIAEGRPIGFLFFSHMQPGTYEPSHSIAFQEIAAQLSVAVERSVVYDRLVTANRQLRRSQEQLEYQSRHDDLTGLPNRTAILDELARTDALARRTGTRYGVLMIDVDQLKGINDCHGQQAGDAALRQVGASLASVLCPGEALGRYGGEEFMAILEAQDETMLATAAERFRVSVSAEPMALMDKIHLVTISVGGALSPVGCGGGWEQRIAAAFDALNVAKAAGCNRVEICRRDQDQSATTSINSGKG